MDTRTMRALEEVMIMHCTMAHAGVISRCVDCAACSALYRLLRWVQGQVWAPPPQPVQEEAP
jgi:hypothetical protein